MSTVQTNALWQACQEVRLRVGQGERDVTEAVLARHSELASAEDATVELIYTEYTARLEADESVNPQEFIHRFPGYADRIRNLIAIHQALQEDPLATTRLEGRSQTLVEGSPRTDHRRSEGHHRQVAVSSIGPYQLREFIGQGGVGVVYRARQPGLDRDVALKIIPRPFDTSTVVARFELEAKAAAKLRHPNIVHVYDVGETEDCLYLSMEFLPRGSLDQLLAKGLPTIPDACAMLRQIAGGIQHAHDHGIVHRDLKPANILLAEDGRPQITDFGLAFQLPLASSLSRTGGIQTRNDSGRLGIACAKGETKDRETGRLTEAGTLVGTPAYMAPEQTTGAMMGHAVDVYGLGAILYELITGRPPFQGPSPMEVLEQVRRDDPISPRRHNPAISRDLATICLKCLQKEPACRYVTAQALSDDLDRFLAGKPVQARRLTWMTRIGRWCRRNPALAGLAAACATLLVTLAIVGTWTGWRQSVLAERARQGEVKAKQAEQEAKAVTEYLVDSFRGADPTSESKSDSIAEMLNVAIRNVDKRFSDEMSAKSALLLALAKTCERRGDYQQAVQLAERGRHLRQHTLGPTDRGTLEAELTLASAYDAAGRAVESLQLLEHAYGVLAQRWGEQDDLTIAVKEKLASLLQANQDLPGSIDLLQQVHDELVRQRGQSDPDTISAFVKLTNARLRWDEPQKWIPEIEQQLRTVRSNPSIPHLTLAQLQTSLAYAYHRAGQPNKAEPLYREAYEMLQQKVGEDHPLCQTALSDLADVMVELGHYQQAREVNVRLWEYRSTVFGPDHPTTLVSQHNLAQVESYLGHHVQARDGLQDVLNRRRAALGPDHVDTLESEVALGLELRRLNEWQAAIDVLEPFVARTSTLLPTGNSLILRGMSGLGTAYHGMGRVDEAIAIQQKLVDATKEHLGPRHPYTGVFMSELAKSYRTAQKFDEALDLVRVAATISHDTYGPGHPSFAIAQFHLGRALYEAGNTGAAESIFRELLAGDYEMVNNGLLVAEIQCYLGAILRDQEQFDEAERLLLSGYRTIEQASVEGTGTLDAIRRTHAAALVQLYLKWGKPEEAARWR